MKSPDDPLQNPMNSAPDTIDFLEGKPAAPKLPQFLDGKEELSRLGKYEILERLGSGGMGVVYRAADRPGQRFVALKVVTGDQTSVEAAQRFQREVEALAELHHQHIVPILESGQLGYTFYLSMPLMEGGNLRRRAAEFRDRPDEAVRLLLQVSDAVAYAHEQRILHLDLKLDNVFFDLAGNAYVGDFGLARTLHDSLRDTPSNDASLTRTGAIVGTPSYMAPEQAGGEGQRFGPATDVYGLGAILYELLTGRPPFRAVTVLDTIQQVRTQAPVPLRRLQPNVDPELEAICLKCLQKDPRQRYASVRELAKDLQRFRDGQRITSDRRLRLGLPSRRARLLRLGLPFWRARLANWWQRLKRWFTVPGLLTPRSAIFLLHPVLQNVSDGMVVLDSDGRFAHANAAAVKLLGRDPVGLFLRDWLAGHRWHPLDQVRDVPLGAFPLARALLGETVAETEIFLATAQQPEGIWLRWTAHPLLPGKKAAGAVGIFRDVSRLRALAPEEAKHLALWDDLRLNVFRKDLEGRYTFANSVFCATVGRPLPEVLGRTNVDFFRQQEAENYRRNDLQVITSRRVVGGVEEHRSADCAPVCRCRSPGPVSDGQPELPAEVASPVDDMRYVQWLLAPVYDSGGQVVGTQGIFWNITAQRQAERKLAALAEELRHANAELARSNADLEQFAYAASHDLQEPLRMVAQFTELLQNRYQGRLDADADDFIGFAVDGAKRMQILINDLLTYSRVNQRGKPPVATDCGDVWQRAVANLEAAIRESEAVVTWSNLPVVWGDRVQLVMLFQNLIHNAIKFRSTEPPHIHVECERQGQEWLFTVADNGIGIDPKYAERIFVLFQRLHGRDKYPGTGIGLALCKRIVERHGGRIWVEPRPAGGSLFCFTLPGVAEAAGSNVA
jgi:signal transduction histidine kinase/serine/threonine protein kinase